MRIEEIPDVDLDDGPTRLALHIAVRADRFLGLSSEAAEK